MYRGRKALALIGTLAMVFSACAYGAASAHKQNAAVSVASPIAIPSGATNPQLLAKLEALNERIALLSARLKAVELQAQIAAKEAKFANPDAQNSDSDDTTPTAKSRGPNTQTSGGKLPVVKGIAGVGNHLYATISWGSSGEQTVSVGDHVGNGWRVVKVDADTVILARAGRRVPLRFGEAPPQTQQPSAVPGLIQPSTFHGVAGHILP